MAEPEFPCHWTHPHGRHPWTPLLPDPDAPRVLHLDPHQPITCPGRPAPVTTPVIPIDQLQLQRSDDPAGMAGSTDVRIGEHAVVSIGGGSHGWRFRVQLTPGQAIIGFGKFGTIGVGFEEEDRDWNSNLPYTSGLRRIADHIGDNRVTGNEDDVIPYDTALAAIALIRDAAAEEPGRGAVCPTCRNRNRTAQDNGEPAIAYDHWHEDCTWEPLEPDYWARSAAEAEKRGRNELGWLNPEPDEDGE